MTKGLDSRDPPPRPARPGLRPLLERRLVVVTGKGGVGKTTVACALAEAARAAGRRVLLVETSAHEAIAARFESSPRPLGHAGRPLAPGLHALHIDPHAALAEYVRLQVGLGGLTDRILRAEIFGQLLEAAPGWRELIVLGKIWHLEQRRNPDGRPTWDLIVVDAPATGHGLAFLDVPRVVQQAVRAGPLARHASWVEALVRDPVRSLLLPVTLPEELPAQETSELVRRARDEVGIAVDRVVVNRMPDARAGRALAWIAGIAEEGPELSALPPLPALHALLGHEARRSVEAQRWRSTVSSACALPVVSLPFRATGQGPQSGWQASAAAILAEPEWTPAAPLAPDGAASTSTRATQATGERTRFNPANVEASNADAGLSHALPSAHTRAAEAIDEALERARVIVCVGSGGVGKTTIAAALALAAARRGRRTLALTIDPARRLANAFGLAELGAEPRRIVLPPPEELTMVGAVRDAASSNAPGPAPELDIMMLEPRHAFDQLVRRLTPDETIRRRILDNRIYRHLSEALAGSGEYAAMAEVQARADAGAHDLIVVDTPPAEHAADFLRAPARLEAFLESRFFHALVGPALSASRLSLRLFARPLQRAIGLLERITGLGFLEDLTELLRAIDGLSDTLARQTRRAREVLLGEGTRFLLVARASERDETGGRDALAEIEGEGAPLAAIVVNRLRPWPVAESPDSILERCSEAALAADLAVLARSLEAGGRASVGGETDGRAPDRSEPPPVAAELAEAVLEYTRLCSSERARLGALGVLADERRIGLAAIPEQSGTLDPIASLELIGRALGGRPQSGTLASTRAAPGTARSTPNGAVVEVDSDRSPDGDARSARLAP